MGLIFLGSGFTLERKQWMGAMAPLFYTIITKAPGSSVADLTFPVACICKCQADITKYTAVQALCRILLGY
jgi:hypothetical protein